MCQGLDRGGSGLRCYCADGAEQRGVDGAAKEKKISTHLLDKFLAFGVERRRGFGRSGVLLPRPVFDGGAREWGMLWLRGRLVPKLLEGACDVSGHQKMYVLSFVVLIECHANVSPAFLICCDLVVLLDCLF